MSGYKILVIPLLLFVVALISMGASSAQEESKRGGGDVPESPDVQLVGVAFPGVSNRPLGERVEVLSFARLKNSSDEPFTADTLLATIDPDAVSFVTLSILVVQGSLQDQSVHRLLLAGTKCRGKGENSPCAFRISPPLSVPAGKEFSFSTWGTLRNESRLLGQIVVGELVGAQGTLGDARVRATATAVDVRYRIY